MLVGAMVAVSLATAAGAQATSAFRRTPVIDGLQRPTAFQIAPDGQVFIATQDGLVQQFDSVDDPSPTTVIDLRTNVHAYWDRGLLGLEIDPNFATNPYLYVLYAYDHILGDPSPPPQWGTATSDDCPAPPSSPGTCVASARLSRFRLTGTTAGPEQVLVEGWCHGTPIHSIGELEFAPDGSLYAGAGDGSNPFRFDYGQPTDPCADPGAPPPTLPGAQGGALVAQDLRTPGDPVSLLGSIIRVDPATGAGLPTNPHGSATDANERRILAYGLRNPFRFTTRPGTSELWIGDVGWNRHDEIDRLMTPTTAPIENFGWPCYEGTEIPSVGSPAATVCTDLWADGPSAVVSPWLDLPHGEPVAPSDAAEGCDIGNGSPSGLAFGTDTTYPSQYDGALFFGDYARRCVWVAFPGAGGVPDPTTTDVFASGIFPVDMETGADGSLYVLDYVLGQLVRFDYVGGNAPPVASISASPEASLAPLVSTLDASASYDPDPGEAITFAWDLDADGQFDDGLGPTETATFNADGRHTVRVRVTDARGASTTASKVLTVGVPNAAPRVTFDGSIPAAWAVGDTIDVQASGSDAEDGTLGAGAFAWDLGIQHCGPSSCHYHHLRSWTGVSAITFVTPPHDYPSYLELEVRVTDEAGATATRTRRLDPDTSTLRVGSTPTGAPIVVGDQQIDTTTVIAGTSVRVVAPLAFERASRRLEFSAWSDGVTTAIRDLTIGRDDVDLTAIYRAGPALALALDDGQGSVARDSSGNNRNARLRGATWAAGHTAGGLRFEGDDRARVGLVDAGDRSTVAAWVAPDRQTSGQQVIASQPGAWALRLDGQGAVPTAVVIDGDRRVVVRADAGLAAGTWSHVALVRGPHRVRLLVDGTVVASRRLRAVWASEPRPLILGRSLHGTLDDVRVYPRALQATEIIDISRRPVVDLTL